MTDPDDETPAHPARAISGEAELLYDAQLALAQLATDCGSAAEGLDTLTGADRADCLALFRRRLKKVNEHLAELLAGLGH